MANTYDVGDLIRVTGTLDDAADVLLDPTGLTFSFMNPAKVITIYTYGVDAALVKSAVGIYYADISITAAGKWRYEFASTGTGQAADVGSFEVRRDRFG